MASGTKTDNHNPAAKLDLRRYFLRKYHGEESPADVFDCCQGSGLLWRQLRSEFTVARYWGVDVKPKPGRLKIDSIRVLDQGGWAWNCIDVDTYGSPWKHWNAITRHVMHPTTVFLTIGMVKIMGGQLDRFAWAAMGLNFRRLQMPPSLASKLSDDSLPYCLAAAGPKCRIIEAVESSSTGNARYIGVRLQPLAP